MQNYKIIVQYDGTKYNGWQKQGNTDNTIQAKLENILTKWQGSEVLVNGSGRTDAGTHSKGQCANFKLNEKKSELEVLTYLNEYLPRDIAVISVKFAEDRFHARLNAKAKKYEYTISNGIYENVFEKNFHWRLKENLNIEEMQKASKILIGEHDFKVFCSLKKYKKSTVRKIFDIKIEENKTTGEIKFVFYGNGFLYNMVRIMVGTLVEVGNGKRKAEDIEKLFDMDKREFAGETAPACGLCLMEVEY